MNEIQKENAKVAVECFWPQEMVEHKGGTYPKPFDVQDIISGKEYYIADPVSEIMIFCVEACASDVMFRLAKGRNMLHETKEAAIQHAKVMLGVGDE